MSLRDLLHERPYGSKTFLKNLLNNHFRMLLWCLGGVGLYGSYNRYSSIQEMQRVANFCRQQPWYK